MNIAVRVMDLKIYRSDGQIQESTTTIIGDDNQVQWVAEQHADVNACGVTISDEHGKIVGKAGNVQ